MARVDRAGPVRSEPLILWYGLTHARSVAASIDEFGRVEPMQALSLDLPAAQHLAELIIYTPTGRRRGLLSHGTFDRAA